MKVDNPGKNSSAIGKVLIAACIALMLVSACSKPAATLVEAAKENDPASIKTLIEQGHKVNGRDISGSTPLHYAASEGSVDAIRALLDNGAQIDSRTNEGFTPLHRAIGNTQEEAALELLQRGADPSIKNNGGADALQFAKVFGANRVVEFLESSAAK